MMRSGTFASNMSKYNSFVKMLKKGLHGKRNTLKDVTATGGHSNAYIPHFSSRCGQACRNRRLMLIADTCNPTKWGLRST
jgi:hypothetical protein